MSLTRKKEERTREFTYLLFNVVPLCGSTITRGRRQRASRELAGYLIVCMHACMLEKERNLFFAASLRVILRGRVDREKEEEQSVVSFFPCIIDWCSFVKTFLSSDLHEPLVRSRKNERKKKRKEERLTTDERV